MHNSRAGDPDGIAMPLPPKEQLDANTSWPVVVDAALMMAAGDSATIFMKLDSFILSMLPPRLHSEKEVRYEMKLLSIESAEQINIMREKARVRQKMVAEKVTATTASYRQGELDSRLLTLPSGLKMLIEQPGDGAEFQQGGMVRAHYYGCLTDGTHFDDSYTRGQPLEFQAGVGQMIAGFDEGVMQLRRGGKAFLFIPPALGYGDAGAGGVIPPNATLVFYIELL